MELSPTRAPWVRQNHTIGTPLAHFPELESERSIFNRNQTGLVLTRYGITARGPSWSSDHSRTATENAPNCMIWPAALLTRPKFLSAQAGAYSLEGTSETLEAETTGHSSTTSLGGNISSAARLTHNPSNDEMGILYCFYYGLTD